MENTMKDKATPRPWKAEMLGANSVWINGMADERGPMPLARMCCADADLDNASLIVKAVNNHDALLDACRSALLVIESAGISNDWPKNIVDKIERAISQATK